MSDKNEDLIDYYTKLLILQYSGKTNASETIKVIAEKFVVYDLLVAIRDGFNIDDAIGDQLDILAKYVGAERDIPGTDLSYDYFGYAEYGDTSPFTYDGYASYDTESSSIDWRYKSYSASNTASYTLTDSELRTLIKLAIIRNSSNGSLKAIDDLFDMLFSGDAYIFDNEDGSVVLEVSSSIIKIINIANNLELLPKPAGIKITVAENLAVVTSIWYTDLISETDYDAEITYSSEIMTITNVTTSYDSDNERLAVSY